MKYSELIRQITKAVNDIKYCGCGTYHWILDMNDDKNDWAIVLGYNKGYDNTEQDEFSDGEYRLCLKLAYQPNNSIMQCDYDIDWLMPYNKETGEVDDTEIAIYSLMNVEKELEWLLKQYQRYYEEYKNKNKE